MSDFDSNNEDQGFVLKGVGGWKLPIVFFIIASIFIGTSQYFSLNLTRPLFVSLILFGALFLLMSIHFILDSIRSRIEVDASIISIFTAWKKRIVNWEDIEELAIEEIIYSEHKKERFYSLRPKKARAICFTSAWENVDKIENYVDEREIEKTLNSFRVQA